MDHERRNPARLTPPTGYSHAVRAGNLLFLSGQLALDENRQLIGRGDIEAQTRRTFENLSILLEDAGQGWRDVVKLTIFLTDIGGIEIVRRVRAEVFEAAGALPPAITTVEVSRLAVDGAMIEVEGIAVRRDE